jgi:hypothetical protein
MEQSNYHVRREQTSALNPVIYQVRDMQQKIVCECDELHNAQLIKKLLEKYT